MEASFIDVVMIGVAAVLGALAMKLLDKLRGRDAETEARDIVQRAERDAANRIREAELEITGTAVKAKMAEGIDVFSPSFGSAASDHGIHVLSGIRDSNVLVNPVSSPDDCPRGAHKEKDIGEARGPQTVFSAAVAGWPCSPEVGYSFALLPRNR